MSVAFLALLACSDYAIVDACESADAWVVCHVDVPASDAEDVCDSRGLVLAQLDGPPRPGSPEMAIVDVLEADAWVAPVGSPCADLGPSGTLSSLQSCDVLHAVVCE